MAGNVNYGNVKAGFYCIPFEIILPHGTLQVKIYIKKLSN
jgi:hypothetical protein